MLKTKSSWTYKFNTSFNISSKSVLFFFIIFSTRIKNSSNRLLHIIVSAWNKSSAPAFRLSFCSGQAFPPEATTLLIQLVNISTVHNSWNVLINIIKTFHAAVLDICYETKEILTLKGNFLFQQRDRNNITSLQTERGAVWTGVFDEATNSLSEE